MPAGPADPTVERKLAAILAADIAGYSRLMGADEAGTFARLSASRPPPAPVRCGVESRLLRRAGVAQSAESELKVAGSIPVARSNTAEPQRRSSGRGPSLMASRRLSIVSSAKMS